MNEQELQKELEKILESIHKSQLDLVNVTLEAIGKAMQLGVKFGLESSQKLVDNVSKE